MLCYSLGTASLRRTCRTFGTQVGPEIIAQLKLRLAWEPWLMTKWRKPAADWYVSWQTEVQAMAVELESAKFGTGCFLAPSAVLRGKVRCGDRSLIAADCFLRGPIRLGEDVSINPRCQLHGGMSGITIGDGSRVAAGATMFAYNHGIDADSRVMDQPCTSRGITIGQDVWIGANASIVDGVTVSDHGVVGMGAVVTKDVAPWTIVAGNPARVVGDRRERKPLAGEER
jgi:acetyltransferase-like isoleucine patch superfamily enzyme